MGPLKRFILAIGLALALSAVPAKAVVFSDGPALIQRAVQLLQVLHQWTQIIKSTNAQLAAVQAAYAGLRDWRNLGWVDTLRLVDSPWFDGIQGIDDIRRATTLTIASVQEAQDLFNNAQEFRKLINDHRYKTDSWYRWQINSLLKQSDRARRTKEALFRQMRTENKALMQDVIKLRELHDTINRASLAPKGADLATIAACQAEIAAIQAKHQGESLILRNQQAIMAMVGQEGMLRSYLAEEERFSQPPGSTEICRTLIRSMKKRSR